MEAVKAVVAFVGGALAAGALVFWLVKKDQPAPAPPVEQAAAPAVTPGGQLETPPLSAPEPAPAQAAAAEPARGKPSPAKRLEKRQARSEPPAEAPAQPATQSPPLTAPPEAPAPQPAVAPAPAPEPPPVRAEPPPAPAPKPRVVTLPAGTLITVRLAETLSADKTKPGESFAATLDQPLMADGLVIAERGARAEGRVVESKEAGRLKGISSLAIELVKLRTSDGQTVELKTQTFQKEGPKSVGGDAAKIGAAAAVGAAIGAIAGGGRGAAIGAGVGGAAGTGGVMATRGKAAEIPVETRISFRLDEPITLTERMKK